MHEAIDHRRCRHGILEDLLPLGERQVAREHDAATLVAIRQEREQDFHFLTALLHIADIVKDHRLVLREPLEHSRQLEIPLRHKELLDEKRASPEEDPPPFVHELLADGAEQVSLPATRISEGENVFAAIDE